MALPIAETPILKGRDAKKFLQEIENNHQELSLEDRKRMKKNYEELAQAFKDANLL